MKKIGVLTFHRAINYGAVLQTYGLITTLHAIAPGCQVIDYRGERLENHYKPIYLPKNKNKLKSLAKCMIKYPIAVKRRKVFSQFVSKYIPVTEEIYDDHTIGQANAQFCSYITGSDQVWSPRTVGFDPVYFLTFADGQKKNSYAASFGVREIPENLREEYKKRLSGYSHISVREESAVPMVQELLTDAQPERHIDPSLLLNAEQWGKLAAAPKDRGYVLLFTVNMPKKLIAFARSLAAAKGLKMIYINEKPIFCEKGIEYRRSASPEEFLGLIKHADYVVTNSFHGTAFSVNFRKNFYVELDTKSGRNTRAESLLKILGISGREITEDVYKGTDSEIDWNHVEQELGVEREKALQYLKCIVEECNE